MAGDWIKWRAELSTHPRFMALCSSLIFDDARHGMLVYACGDSLGIGVMPPRNENVTDRALRCVTEPALRDVCMGALLRVWAAVNAHCKVRELDAVMAPMSLIDLDAIARFADFGDAMQAAGWVVEDDKNTLVFPNFLEFNEPACLRRAPKSSKERQQELRARKAAEKTETERVTKVTKRNGREEKRRVDKIGRAARGTTIPPDFILTPERADLGKKIGVDPVSEFDQFRDHHTARGTTFRDWDAGWRTWLRNAKKFSQPRGQARSHTGNPHSDLKLRFTCRECGNEHRVPYGQPESCQRGAA